MCTLYLVAPACIISTAQQASPKVISCMELWKKIHVNIRNSYNEDYTSVLYVHLLVHGCLMTHKVCVLLGEYYYLYSAL